MMEKDFIKRALDDLVDIWSEKKIAKLASFEVPHSLLGRRQNLLKGDINEQWAQWFVESLVDPRRISDKKITYPFLYEEVFRAVEEKFRSEKTRPEQQEIASATAKVIFSLSRSFSEKRRRRAITLNERRLLLDISGPQPRCWICGVAFKDQAIENFLFGKKTKVDLPPFVDVLKPQGLVERDFLIEVDHVMPFSKGGENDANLKLACGWCNRNKSAYMSIYDVEGQPRQANYNSLGITSLPQPFWIVRLLAIVQRCENPGGCSRSVKDTELTIVPIQEGGALNPANLRVICSEHDPFRRNRLQPPGLVKEIWRY